MPVPGKVFLWSSLVLWSAVGACRGDDLVAPEVEAEVPAGAAAEFTELVNAHRASLGCPALSWNGSVAGVAQAHSDDMVARDFFSHTNPDGLSPFDRLSVAGVTFSAAAENIAFGYPTAQAVLEAWLDSPGHRANIENCALTEHGVGLTQAHWTHLFIRP